MLSTALCLALLAQAPADDAPKVAVPALKLVNLDEKLADFYSGHLAQQLSFQGVRTITSSEISALLGLERQKQLLGCTDDTCKADLMASLGVDGIVVGTITKLDKSLQLDVRIVAAGDGRPLAGASSNSEDNDRLVGTFAVVAQQLARQLAEKLGRKLATAPGVELVQGASRIKRLSWAPAALGVAAIVTGAVFLGLSRGYYGRLTTPPTGAPLDMGTTEGIASRGATQQTVGWVLVGSGAACVAAAALMFFLGGNDTVTAGVTLVPHGAGFSLAGAF